MLFNLKHKFVYVHLPKTGGTSIRKALESKSETESFISRDRKHMSARQIRDYLGTETYSSMTSFAHVRNPWDLEVSAYHYVLQNEGHYLHNVFKKLGSFDNYISWRCRHVPFQQTNMVSDESGNLIVDHIHKFENLAESYVEIMKRLDIKSDLPKLNSSKHREYHSYYNEKTKRLVAQAFDKDIELFGYSWSGK
ncbi:MAG TPA: sulfotransferase family 2 domain-containing protein [Allosphingosinicella sp.]|nr:sulfotransferase family 2 domain-containing protein [Allosphingosinicella sp.]